MYVAMTRARRTLTFMAPKSRPSSFVTELIEAGGVNSISGISSERPHHKCGECGGRLVDVDGKDGASGIDASMISIAAISFRLAQPVEETYRARYRRQPNQAAVAEPVIRLAPNAMTVACGVIWQVWRLPGMYQISIVFWDGKTRRTGCCRHLRKSTKEIPSSPDSFIQANMTVSAFGSRQHQAERLEWGAWPTRCCDRRPAR